MDEQNKIELLKKNRFCRSHRGWYRLRNVSSKWRKIVLLEKM